jgi:hypothetical protein
MLLLVKNSVKEAWGMRCRDAIASSFVTKVRGEVFAHFHAVAVKLHSSVRNWLFGLPGRILCEQSPWCQIKWCACSWLCSSPASPMLMLSYPNACPMIVGVSVSLFPRLADNFYAHSLSDPSRNRISPDTRLQMKGRINQHTHPAAWNVVLWFPRYASTIICRCIALLQLLYIGSTSPQNHGYLLVYFSVYAQLHFSSSSSLYCKYTYAACFGLIGHLQVYKLVLCCRSL